jgi:hypothetical protein
MQSKLLKDLRNLDSSMENIKKEIPAKILKMTIREVSLLKALSEANVDENQQILNATVKETISKADEGKFNVTTHFISFYSAIIFITLFYVYFMLSSISNSIAHHLSSFSLSLWLLPILFLKQKRLYYRREESYRIQFRRIEQ